VLAEYVDAAPASRGPGPPAFFVNRRGGVIPHQTVWWNFASLRTRAGVPGHLHDLRHYVPFLTMSCPAMLGSFSRHALENLPT
jgi:integrase